MDTTTGKHVGDYSMESFVDAHSHRPVQHIEIVEGETKILGLKKLGPGNSQSVKVAAKDPAVAFCDQAFHLKDTTKHKYRDDDPDFKSDPLHWRRMSSFLGDKGELIAVVQ